MNQGGPEGLRPEGDRGPLSARPPTKPPAPKGRTRALVLALAMHILLVGLLFIGIRWKSQEPAGVSAELWTPPPPAPVERPTPKPEPKPEPKPDIAIEQERRRREEDERKERENKAREEKARKEAEAKKLAEAKRAEEKKAAEDKARKEAEEKKLAEDKARKEAEAKKLAEAKAAEAKRRAEEEKVRQERIEAERSRAAQLLAQSSAGSSGATAGGDGLAAATWGGQIKALVRDATTYSSSGSSNPEARFRIRLTAQPGPASGDARDCRIIDVQLTRSSGEQAWDRAAEQAIRKSSPWPRMPNGSCPNDAIDLSQRPRD